MSRLVWPRLLSLLFLGPRCRPLGKPQPRPQGGPPFRSKFSIPVCASRLGTHELLVKSTSAAHLHWLQSTIQWAQIASAVSDVIWVCWVKFCPCLANLAHSLGAVHKHNTEISVRRYLRLWLCTVSYSFSVKEFDNLEAADAWDGELLTKS